MAVNVHIHDKYTLDGYEINLDQISKSNINRGLNDFILQIKAIDSGIKLDNLKHIFVPKDYTNELIDFQRKHGLKEGHTSNEMGLGFAMTLPIKNEDNTKEYVIFIRPEIMVALCSFNGKVLNTKAQQLAQNLIYHELCHVSDMNYQDEIFERKESEQLDILSQILYRTSLFIWEEYYAYRKAASLFPPSDLYIDHFFETITWVEEETIKLIQKFDQDQDMDSFMQKFCEITGFLFRTAAGLHGNLKGIPTSDEQDREKLLALICDEISNSYFLNTFKELGENLDKLFNSYPKWNGLMELEHINKIIMNAWNSLGIYPERIDKETIWVGIDKNE
jgi:hypothetical protein